MGRALEFPDVDVRDLVLKLFSYDPETGVFMRIARMTRSREIVPLPVPELAGTEKEGYLRISLFGKSFYLHRIAWLVVHGRWPTELIDHINGNRSDNRIENLRECSEAENRQNWRQPKSNNPHKLIGVNWHKAARKYTAQIQINRKQKHLGLFETAEEAHSAYLAAKRSLHSFSTI